MQAAVLRQFTGRLALEAVELSTLAADEVLVRTAACGVCHSDRHAQHGESPRARNLPIVLGHEAAGIVLEVGSAVSGIEPGDRVLTCAAAACGTCRWCLRGHQQHCEAMARQRSAQMTPRYSADGMAVEGFVGLGGFASHMLVNERAVALLPDAMPLDRAALLGCAVLTGYGAVKHAAAVKAGDRVAVIGCGGVGLNVIQAARLFGARDILAIDVRPGARERAIQFGATHVLDGRQADVADIARNLIGAADHVFDVVGRPQTVATALEIADTRGTVTVVGLPRPGDRIDIAAEHLFAEKRIQGSKMGRQWRLDVEELCGLYLTGRLMLDELMSRTLPLERINEALDELETADAARTVITF